MVSAYVEFWNRAFDFNGITTRRNYWLTVLMNFIVIFVLSLFPLDPFYILNVSGSYGVPITIATIYSFVALVPGIAITVRRLNDARFSGLFILLELIPIAGIVVFIMTLLPANYNDNKWYEMDREHGSY